MQHLFLTLEPKGWDGQPERVRCRLDCGSVLRRNRVLLLILSYHMGGVGDDDDDGHSHGGRERAGALDAESRTGKSASATKGVIEEWQNVTGEGYAIAASYGGGGGALPAESCIFLLKIWNVVRKVAEPNE